VGSRPAFTLVELLVVLAIIGIVIGLTAAAAFQVIGYQRNSNTDTTIRTVNGILERQWRNVIDQAKRESIPANVMTLAGGDGRRALVIYIKLRLQQEFPMNFWEVVEPPQPPVLPAFAGYFNAYYDAVVAAGGPSNTRPQNPPQNPELGPPNGLPVPSEPMGDESSAMLLVALQRNRGGTALDIDSLGVGRVQNAAFYVYPKLGAAPIKFTMPQLVDAWGRPLRFYRWPTMNDEVDALGPSKTSQSAQNFINRDPLDPEGLLMTQSWYGSQNRQVFESLIHTLSNPSPISLKPARYLVPVIASSGRDGESGILPPTTAKFGPAPDPMQFDTSPTSKHFDYDNIYSYHLREGARGD
jgi:prepilin-type N-terminal cleavage/methylation domain-containing protein